MAPVYFKHAVDALVGSAGKAAATAAVGALLWSGLCRVVNGIAKEVQHPIFTPVSQVGHPACTVKDSQATWCVKSSLHPLMEAMLVQQNLHRLAAATPQCGQADAQPLLHDWHRSRAWCSLLGAVPMWHSGAALCCGATHSVCQVATQQSSLAPAGCRATSRLPHFHARA